MAIHWLDSFENPRNVRNPHDYVARLLEAVVVNICLLRADGSKEFCAPEEQREVAGELFDPVKVLIDQGIETGESLEHKAWEKSGTSPVDPDERARVVYAYCHQAELAYNAGHVTEAWTLVIDAMRVAADLKAVLVHRAGGATLATRRGKNAASARHVRSGHADSQTKEAVKKLWREWKDGGHPRWKTQKDIAERCGAFLGDPKVNPETVQKKWIPQWVKEDAGKK